MSEWSKAGEVPVMPGTYEVRGKYNQTRVLHSNGIWRTVEGYCVGDVSYANKIYSECQFRRIDTPQNEWLDQPDGEGWWWNQFVANLQCLYVFEGPESNLQFIADNGQKRWCEDKMGKWQRAIPPDPPKVDYRGKVGVFKAGEHYRILVPDGKTYEVYGSPSKPIESFDKIEWLHGPYDVKEQGQ